ncbi:MAG TPA: hotdog domain-containing protein [Ureibacillus sp.]|nr:hotdog domain-containing protein [Ureibacillus sp.]
MSLKLGDIFSFERTFTNRDVELFTEISGDAGIHHLAPDEQGRLVVQGLLTATLPTKIGGDHNFIARTMEFEFLRPVFTGDTVICELRVEQWEKDKKGRIAVVTPFICRNQHGKVVLNGVVTGVIL